MILVKDFKKGVGTYSTGKVTILFTFVNSWEMLMVCDIVIFKSRDGLFIKIPQTFDPIQKMRINNLKWPTKEISDAFQAEVKKQLAEKFPEALQIPLLNDARKKRQDFRRNNKNKKPPKPLKPIETKKVENKHFIPRAPRFYVNPLLMKDPPPRKTQSDGKRPYDDKFSRNKSRA